MSEIINTIVEQNNVISTGISGDESISTNTSSQDNLIPFAFDDTKAIQVDIDLVDENEPVDVEIGTVTASGVLKDYRKLSHKPTINGTELYENYDEIDPTVPNWAKESTKPDYTAEEIGAIDEDAEMSFTTIKEVWDSIFNKGD